MNSSDPTFLLALMAALAEAVESLPPAPEQSSEQGGVTAATGAATSVELARPLHIPCPVPPGGDPAVFDTYKTETVLYDGVRGTIKVNHWGAGDPRPEPHSHPWNGERDGTPRVAFISTIIRGGYTEKITRRDGTETIRTFRAGDKNVSMSDEFHVVYDVLPNTVTLMVCSPRVDGSPYGYLVDDGEGGKKYVDSKDPQFGDPTFFARFTLLNPFRRPGPMWAEGLPAALRRQA